MADPDEAIIRADKIIAVQTAFELLTVALLEGDEVAMQELLALAAVELTNRQQNLTIAAILGVLRGLANGLERADPGWSRSEWLAGAAAAVTAEYSL